MTRDLDKKPQGVQHVQSSNVLDNNVQLSAAQGSSVQHDDVQHDDARHSDTQPADNDNRGSINYQTARFEAACGTIEQLPKCSTPEVAIAGRSNVGKSSLLNRLFSRKALAKVSSVPGKTQTINFYMVDGVRFVDLPGYGFAQVGKSDKARWADLIGGYFAQERSFNLVIALVDIRHSAQKLDLQMVEFLRAHEFSFLIVLTKADKLSKHQQLQQKARLAKAFGVSADQIVVSSSMSHQGFDELKRHISDACL